MNDVPILKTINAILIRYQFERGGGGAGEIGYLGRDKASWCHGNKTRSPHTQPQDNLLDANSDIREGVCHMRHHHSTILELLMEALIYRGDKPDANQDPSRPKGVKDSHPKGPWSKQVV